MRSGIGVWGGVLYTEYCVLVRKNYINAEQSMAVTSHRGLSLNGLKAKALILDYFNYFLFPPLS